MAAQFPALLLTGARQTGKTTLLRHIFPDYSYVSLDLPSLAAAASTNPDVFFGRFKPPLIIDEVQYAPELLRHLKVRIDAARELKGQFILTGSQKFLLMQDVSESLAGRLGLVELDTLSSAELLKGTSKPFAPDSPEGLVKLMVRGTFPELWSTPEIDTTEFYRAYVATYLERDVRNFVRIGSLRDFERLLRLCAVNSGQVLNKSNLARDVGVSLPTINAWLSALEASRQIVLLEPYYRNLGKRLVKSPKLYVHDTGLSCFLAGLDERHLRGDPALTGAVWETFVFNQIMRDLTFRSTRATVWFYRDSAGNEMDFLVESGNRVRPVEVKWAQVPSRQDVQKFAGRSHLLGDGRLQPWLACPTQMEYDTEDEVAIVNPAMSRRWDEI